MHLRIHHDDENDPVAYRPEQPEPSVRAFAPPVDREAIFVQLVDQELRRGRLNKTTRARIVRYACGMGVSATRAGELLRQCVDRLAQEEGNVERIFALRVLREPQRPDRLARRLKAAVTFATALLCYLLWWRLRQ